MSWLNLLTPSAAVLAIFLGIALVIQSFRHGRQIRRIEQQIASAGLTAYDPTLERLKELSGLSEKKPPAEDRATGRPIASRRTQIIVAAIVGVVIIAGVAWAVSSHNSSSSKPSTSAKATTHTATTHTATSTKTTVTTPAAVVSCATATPISNPSDVTVSVYNASGVPGAAGKVIGPKLTSIGYSVGTIGNAPNGVSDATVSSVQYVTKSDLPAACSVATALGVSTHDVTALTVMPGSQAGSARVVVLVGRDIAGG